MRLFFVAWLISFSFQLAAQTSAADGVLINADNMFRDLEKKTVKLEGHVQVVFQRQHLSADRATLDLNLKRIRAEGHVILTNESIHIEGEKVDFNYKDDTGLIYKGFVQSGQVVFEGDLIEKVGTNHYLATNGEYTACETCPAGWSFAGRKIDAELGGYARIRRPVFRIAGIPILILPGIIVPLKSARQSGFLVPSPDFSTQGGFAISESYFWAIDRSHDLTFTTKRSDLRGLKFDADYRYVISEKGHGQARTAWTQDRTFNRLLNYDSNIDRWYFLYSHYYDMPERYVQRVDLNLVSDLRWPRDFTNEVKGHGDPALENKASISKSTDSHYFSGEMDVYTNLLKSYPLASNEESVHRVPELRYSLKEQSLWDFGPSFGLNVNYVNFARDRYNYDDVDKSKDVNSILGSRGEVVRDGKYDYSTDIFRTGQRLDVTPSLSYPFQIFRAFEFTPTIFLRETQYKFYPTHIAEFPTADTPGFSSTAARRYLQTDLSMKTEFTGVFGDLGDPKSNRWKHSFEPELKYSQIPWARRPDHPFFGEFQGQQHSRQYDPITETDIYNSNSRLQFDYEDRTYDRRYIDFSITNRFTKKTWLNDEPDYRTAVLFKVSQSYDFKESQSPSPHPWSPLNALLDARFDHFETSSTAAYNSYAKVTNLSSRVKVLLDTKNFLQVAYSRNFALDDDYNVTGETRNVGIGGGVRTKYVDLSGQVDLFATDYRVQSWMYILGLRPPGRCWHIKFEHTQVVGSNDTIIKGSIAFDFGGDNIGRVN